MKFLCPFFILLSMCFISGCAGKSEQAALQNCTSKGIRLDICYQEYKADQRSINMSNKLLLQKQNENIIRNMGIKGVGLPQ